jgi:hypothetical protein
MSRIPATGSNNGTGRLRPFAPSDSSCTAAFLPFVPYSLGVE